MYDFCNDSQHMLCFSLVFHVFTCLREMLHKKSAGVHLNLRCFKRYSIDPCVYAYHPQRDEHIYLHPHSFLLDSPRKTISSEMQLFKSMKWEYFENTAFFQTRIVHPRKPTAKQTWKRGNKNIDPKDVQFFGGSGSTSRSSSLHVVGRVIHWNPRGLNYQGKQHYQVLPSWRKIHRGPSSWWHVIISIYNWIVSWVKRGSCLEVGPQTLSSFFVNRFPFLFNHIEKSNREPWGFPKKKHPCRFSKYLSWILWEQYEKPDVKQPNPMKNTSPPTIKKSPPTPNHKKYGWK